MRHGLRNFILGFLLLWLPLQGYAAAGMTFCRHDHTPPPAMQAEMQEHHAGHDCDTGQNSPSASLQMQCDDCGYCYLGAAPALPTATMALQDEAGFSFRFAISSPFLLFYPEQPQRPPHAWLS